MQESSSFVGLRTQSIQLLRDGLYRLCEGYMNGSLTAAQYDILMRRYQKYMIALLGIEQLSGVVRAPTVVIGTQGSAQAAQSISSIRMQIDSVDSHIAALEKEKGTEGVSEERKKQIDVEIEDLKKDRTALERAISNARGLAASGETGLVEISYPSASTGQSAGTQNAEIVKAVENIVISVINVDDTGQLCFLHLAQAQLNPTHPLTRSCEALLQRQDQILEIRAAAAAQLLDAVGDGDAADVSAAIRDVNLLIPPLAPAAPGGMMPAQR
jgi:TolA-binding protein